MKTSLQSFDGKTGCDLAAVLASDAIGDSKQPSLVLGRVMARSGMAQRVFVVLADFAYVGKLRELELEHATLGKGLAASRTGGAESRSLMNL